jgi:hypothetical protein
MEGIAPITFEDVTYIQGYVDTRRWRELKKIPGVLDVWDNPAENAAYRSLLAEVYAARPRVTLIIRIKPGARIGKVLAGLPGILESTKLFRGEDDPDLAFLYILKVRGDAALQVIDALETSPLVEQVEDVPRKRLIGPVRPRDNVSPVRS